MQLSKNIRKLHLNIPEDVHQRLRVICAYEDKSMQDFVTELIAEAVKDVRLPRTKKEAQ